MPNAPAKAIRRVGHNAAFAVDFLFLDWTSDEIKIIALEIDEQRDGKVGFESSQHGKPMKAPEIFAWRKIVRLSDGDLMTARHGRHLIFNAKIAADGQCIVDSRVGEEFAIRDIADAHRPPWGGTARLGEAAQG